MPIFSTRVHGTRGNQSRWDELRPGTAPQHEDDKQIVESKPG